MDTILELRETRAKKWKATKAFLDSRRQENRTLSAEDDAIYIKMKQEIIDLGKEIERSEHEKATEELDRMSIEDYRQGWKDAIDKCIKYVQTYDDTDIDLYTVTKITDSIVNILEQIKEQNNA